MEDESYVSDLRVKSQNIFSAGGCSGATFEFFTTQESSANDFQCLKIIGGQWGNVEFERIETKDGNGNGFKLSWRGTIELREMVDFMAAVEKVL